MAKPGKGKDGDKPVEIKVLARNRKARHDYHVEESLEAGIMLAGSEVKSIRDGKGSLIDAWAEVDGGGEAWLHQMDVGAYAWAHARNHEPRRRRKLLMHRREIDRLAGLVSSKGVTIVPLAIYDKGGKIKVELAVVRGKQDHDRREDIRERESRREIDRAMASRRR